MRTGLIPYGGKEASVVAGVEDAPNIDTWGDVRALLARYRVTNIEVAQRLGMGRQEFGVHINGDAVSLPYGEFIERVLTALAEIVAERG